MAPFDRVLLQGAVGEPLVKDIASDVSSVAFYAERITFFPPTFPPKGRNRKSRRETFPMIKFNNLLMLVLLA